MLQIFAELLPLNMHVPARKQNNSPALKAHSELLVNKNGREPSGTCKYSTKWSHKRRKRYERLYHQNVPEMRWHLSAFSPLQHRNARRKLVAADDFNQ